MSEIHPVVIIGAGASGIGVGALLARCEVPTLILERGHIGESFKTWPKETRFISPSFTGNFFGAVDLNAVTPETSPAFGFQSEHPSGQQYATYLEDIAGAYNLTIEEGVDVQGFDVDKKGVIALTTNEGEIKCRALIWAGGEFQYPKTIPHTVRVGKSYKDFPKGHHVIIGGSESGIETAYNLVKNGSSVTVIDPSAPWAKRVSDSSYGLTPFTFARLRSLLKSDQAEFVAEFAEDINESAVLTESRIINLDYPAIDATGFETQKSLAGDLFHFPEGYPELTDRDESTKYKNVYLVGPNVQHDKAIFCFIYKYRQRFAVVANEILNRRGEKSPVIDDYADKGFYLDDLSCCDEECVC
ncbi:MAG: NAD(P)/FAD-dependent oxidoreductase [Pseudomonadota bacterium]